MLLQYSAAAVAGAPRRHPLTGTAAEWMWALPAAAAARLRPQRRAVAILGAAHVGPARSVGRGTRAHGPRRGAQRCDRRAHDGGSPRRMRRRRATGSPRLVSIIGPLVLIARLRSRVRDLCRDGRGTPDARRSFRRYFSWMPVGDLQIDAAFQLDQLSMMIVLVITGVGALIHIFSVGYMRDDPGYPRYFAYLNLFVFFMLVLVLGANLPDDVRRVGGRRALLVPADRVLVLGPGERRRGQEGVHRQPHRRLRLPDRDVPAVREHRHARLHGSSRRGAGARRRAAPLVTTICLFLLPGLHGQERADPALRLAPRRDGRPDAGVRADPRGDDGHRRRLPGGAERRCCSRSPRRRASRSA